MVLFKVQLDNNVKVLQLIQIPQTQQPLMYNYPLTLLNKLREPIEVESMVIFNIKFVMLACVVVYYNTLNTELEFTTNYVPDIEINYIQSMVNYQFGDNIAPVPKTKLFIYILILTKVFQDLKRVKGVPIDQISIRALLISIESNAYPDVQFVDYTALVTTGISKVLKVYNYCQHQNHNSYSFVYQTMLDISANC
ncbi:Hypothetical_protein [Hexamita inflata]|uniref:Hypothetical_protein n=1 Tax=Hexamita inflata TaxID=28002 RepID=A0ABP1KB10_9EUKA